MHAELRIAGKPKECHGTHKRLGLEGDVVIHEQHVRGPPFGAQMHETAGKPARTTQVSIAHQREVIARHRTQVEVARIVDDEHPHPTTQDGAGTHEVEHALHRGHYVLLAVEGGDRQIEPHITCRGRSCRPLDTLHRAATLGEDSHIQHTPCRGGERTEVDGDAITHDRRGGYHTFLPARDTDNLDPTDTRSHHSHR